MEHGINPRKYQLILYKLHWYFLIFTGLLFWQITVAEPLDSILSINDLTFKNEVEKQAFKKYNTSPDSTDIIDLFLTPFEKENGFNSKIAHQKIQDCVNYLKPEIANKSDIKKIKFIYSYVHEKFLKVYKVKNCFSDIFENGEYNCVSATALYSIILSKLGVSYHIKEAPGHVFLIANPLKDKVLIETTDPKKGYYQFNAGFVAEYLKNLSDSKIITKKEADTTDVNTLFNKYYFSSDNISLVQLAGLQYSNFGIYFWEDKKHQNAVDEIKKSHFLFPCIRTKYLLKVSLIEILNLNGYDDPKQISNLITLCHISNTIGNEVNKDYLANQFFRIKELQLIKHSDFATFDHSYNLLINAIKDTVLKKDISFDYHYELARLGNMNFKDKKGVLDHLQKAYVINPNHANIQPLILYYFERFIENKNDNIKSAYMEILDFSKKFHFLNDNNEFNSIKANVLLELSYQSFYVNDLINGEQYLKDFETLCKLKKSSTPNTQFVEKTYSVAAAIYYKKGNYQKAKQLLKTGLIYSPDNFGLKQRLNQF